MITFKTLAESDHPHFAESLFEEAFPEQERPPFSSLRHRDAGKFHFLVAENGDDPVGILTYWTFEDLVYVEHFAIAEELRNQGIGKATFLNFLSQQQEQTRWPTTAWSSTPAWASSKIPRNMCNRPIVKVASLWT